LKYVAVRERHEASKLLSPAKHSAGAIKELAQEVFGAADAADGLTLVVVNTIRRACDLHREITKLTRDRAANLLPVLIHSRFRPGDRKERLAELLASKDRKAIVVSTQVVEAGVDVSAQVLFTEIAPWASLVQRFGRCNRRGEFADNVARIYCIDFDEEKLSPPYEPNQLREARQRLRELRSASPATLAAFNLAESDKPRASHVIRCKDIIELFDTTADLAGNDIDIDCLLPEFDSQRAPGNQGVFNAARSEELLRHALFGSATNRMAGDRTSSLFDSGAVGGPNAGQGFERAAIANPWNFILALEGAICFAGALSRRTPPESTSTPSFPFQVQASAIGANSLVAACSVAFPRM
jgi:hypothetical protein